MKKEVISFRLNGRECSCFIHTGAALCEALHLQKCYSVRNSCNPCGSSIVLIDGIAVDACIYPVTRAINRDVTTIEWLESGDDISYIQQEFMNIAGDNCPACIQSLIIASLPLLASPTMPTRYRIASTLQGLLCYHMDMDEVVNAIVAAYGKGRITLNISQGTQDEKRLEMLDTKYAKKKDAPIQLTAIESSSKGSERVVGGTISTKAPDIPTTQSTTATVPQPISVAATQIVPSAVTQPQAVIETPNAVQPTQSSFEHTQAISFSDPSPEQQQPADQANIAPASIFDEGFTESFLNGKKRPSSEDKPKEKVGFFSKFSAAFKEKHHKTLELPDVDGEE